MRYSVSHYCPYCDAGEVYTLGIGWETCPYCGGKPHDFQVSQVEANTQETAIKAVNQQHDGGRLVIHCIEES